jgi:hypothetical protein
MKMTTFLHVPAVLLILGVSGFFVELTADVASAQTTSSVDMVRAFLVTNSDAKSQADLDNMKSYLAPGLRFKGNPGTPFAYDLSFEEWAPLPQPHITINSVLQTGVNTVVADLTIVGEVMPPTRRPYHTTATFTVENGKITGFLEVVSPETYEDLVALQSASPPTGMPQTGAPNVIALVAAIGLALLSILLGLIIQHVTRWLPKSGNIELPSADLVQ